MIAIFGLLFAALVSGSPLPDGQLATRESTTKVPLRILPLGASITWGQHSTTGNGYRKPLRDQLRYDGWEVDMVGRQSHGEMADNDIEATRGYIIDQVAAASKLALPYKPNVILIEAGTNDCRFRDDISDAGDRMRNLIYNITEAADMSKAVFLLSTLLPSGNKKVKANRPSVNAQYRELVPALQKEGISILLADMDPPVENSTQGWISWPEDFKRNGRADVIHPNDYGYEKMAVIWNAAITEAAAQGMILQPASIPARCSSGESGSCLKDHVGDDGPITNPDLPKISTNLTSSMEAEVKRNQGVSGKVAGVLQVLLFGGLAVFLI